MDGNSEQRYAIKFCVRLNKTASETLVMIQDAFKEEAMSRAAVFNWHKRFKDGRQNVEDDDRSGRPSTSRTDNNVDRVRQLLKSDRRLSTRLIGDELGLARRSKTIGNCTTTMRPFTRRTSSLTLWPSST